MGDVTGFTDVTTHCLHGCASEARRLGWNRERYLRVVGDAYGRQLGRQSGTYADQMAMAEQVWMGTK